MGVDIFAGYGMSETGPVLTLAQLTPRMQALERRASRLEVRCKAGRPIPMVDLRIVDEAMNELPHDGAVGRRDRRARALAHPGLPVRRGELRDALARRVAAHR